MPVSDVHPLYTKNIKKSTLTSDVIGGDDSVKAKKELYVPKLDGQTQEEYQAYLNRPTLHNYTNRVLEGLSGLALSKDIQIEVSPALDKMLQDISLSNITIHDLTEDTLSKTMTDGRVGLLVDMATAQEGITKAEAEKLNIRPYITTYPNASIINWGYTNINNEIRLSLVVLKETKAKDDNDIFSHDSETVYRVLSLVNGVYQVDILKEDGTQVVETVFPKMNGELMNFIPFVGITPTKLNLVPDTPPMYNLAKINLTHFKVDVEMYNGMHFASIPLIFGKAIQMDKDETIKMGSTSAYIFPDPQAELKFLEFKGDGLGTHEREKDRLLDAMVTLGSNLLTNTGNKAETSTTVLMRSKGQYSSLSSTCNAVSRGITKALEIMEEWSGRSQEVKFEINTDFIDIMADAQTITATVNAWLSGALSDKEKFEKMKKDGVIVDQNKTFEQHQEEIELNKPTLGE